MKIRGSPVQVRSCPPPRPPREAEPSAAVPVDAASVDATPIDALPEALAQVRDGGLTATIEQFPGQQSALGVQTLVAFIKDGTKPADKVLLLTPVAITKDNLNTAERLGEVK